MHKANSQLSGRKSPLSDENKQREVLDLEKASSREVGIPFRIVVLCRRAYVSGRDKSEATVECDEGRTRVIAEPRVEKSTKYFLELQ